MSSQHVTVDKAFADLKQETGIPHKLALSGSPGYGTDTTYVVAHEYGVEPCVRFTGFVDDKCLSELYADADLIALPCLLGGNGISLHKPMADGTPVCASRTVCKPGVVRDALANRR